MVQIWESLFIFIAMPFYTPSFFMNLKSFQTYLTSYTPSTLHSAHIIVSLYVCIIASALFLQWHDVCFCAPHKQQHYVFYDPWNGNWMVLNWLVLGFIVALCFLFLFSFSSLVNVSTIFCGNKFEMRNSDSSQVFQLQLNSKTRAPKRERKINLFLLLWKCKTYNW